MLKEGNEVRKSIIGYTTQNKDFDSKVDQNITRTT